MDIVVLRPLFSLADTIDQPDNLGQGVVAVSQASLAHVIGNNDYALTPGRLVANLLRSSHRVDKIAAAVEAGEVLGYASFETSLDDALALAEIDVVVHPANRRAGLGSQLLAWVEAEAKELGRTTLQAQAFARPPADGAAIVTAPTGAAMPADSPGLAFAAAHGFDFEQVEASSVLDIPIAQTQLDAWAAQCPIDGYRLHTWGLPMPDEWVEEFARLRSDVPGETPNAGLDAGAETWSAERLRDRWHDWQVAGLDALTVAAEHIVSGKLAAFTQLNLMDHPTAAFQGYTYVEPGHRGHRLGLAVKTQALAALQNRWPQMRRIHTENATENAPMLAINQTMGFRLDCLSAVFQKRLA
ncbi:MAG: GNAT family N-acetyltransferase [Propionibacteriaceae bacterium]|nr:GNAT family N-acetyltransferase [Propionibacteriaceae bacterium]